MPVIPVLGDGNGFWKAQGPAFPARDGGVPGQKETLSLTNRWEVPGDGH